MVRILISGARSSLQNGSMAIILATINTLRKMIGSQIEVAIISDTPQIDYVRYSGLNIQVIGTPWRLKYHSRTLTLLASLFRLLFMLFSHLLLAFLRLPTRNINNYNLFLKFDVVIDLGGDGLSENYGLVLLCNSAFPLFLSLLLKKPFVIYAQSIGPFKSWFTRRLMKFIFDRASLITLREEISKKYLRKIKVKNKNVFLTADPAFLLKPSYPPEVSNHLSEIRGHMHKKIVGVTASQLIYRYAFPTIHDVREKREHYMKLMVDLIKYILKKNDVIVLLIPHAMVPGDDDRPIHEEIFLKLNEDEQKLVIPIRKAYRADEIKGIIGLCDLFISCRMHAAIAAISMRIPTIAFSYGHKFHGVLGRLVEKKQIIDLRYSEWNALLSKLKMAFDYAWTNREKIAKSLEEKMKEIKHKSARNAELVKKLIEFLNMY